MTTRVMTKPIPASGNFSPLPDEVVTLILLKSRDGGRGLLTTALTCKRFFEFNRESLKKCRISFLAFSDRFNKGAREMVWTQFQASEPEFKSMLARISLRTATAKKSLPANSLQGLVAAGTPGTSGSRGIEVCASASPEFAMQIAKTALEGGALEKPYLLMSDLQHALEKTADDQIRCELIILIARLHANARLVQGLDPQEAENAEAAVNAALRAARMALAKVESPTLQLDAMTAELLGWRPDDAKEFGPLLSLCVAEKIVDGSLFSHPNLNSIISIYVVDFLSDLPKDEQAAWWAKIMCSPLYSAIQQFGGSWNDGPWPLQLLAASYAHPLDDSIRETLVANMQKALEKGGSSLSADEFAQLCQQLKRSDLPFRALGFWTQAREQQENAERSKRGNSSRSSHSSHSSDSSNCTVS